MADLRYLPKDRNQRFFHAIEEAGAFQRAIGKAGRWGMDNFHPDAPVDQRETNAAWVKRKLIDLRAALDALEPDLDAEIARQRRDAGGEKYQLLNPKVKARFSDWLKADRAAGAENREVEK